MNPGKSQLVQRVRSWPRRVVIALAAVLVVLLAVRVALPHVIKRQVNQRLAAIPGYGGSVDDIAMSLVRGAYALRDVAIYKRNGAAREPFFSARDIDFSVAWRDLFRGQIVSDVYVKNAELNIVAAPTRETSQKDIDRRWQEVVKDLFPLEITHLEVVDSTVRYQDLTKVPHVDVFIKDMRAVATGLRNRAKPGGGEFPAQITVEGESLGGGQLWLSVAAEPLAAQPHFHLSAKLDRLSLPALNESLKAFANVDVSRGTFRMAAEMAGKDGGFQGYVKPFFEDLDFKNIEDEKRSPLSRLWERVVAGLAWLVKNKSRDQVGTRIPFEGRFGDPQVGFGATVANLFRHGFIRAFNPTVEGSIRAENVLPSGKSADGRNVSEVKSDPPALNTGRKSEENRAGAPTGRPSEPRR